MYINFSYTSLYDEINNSMGLNADGSTNVKYSLTTLRNKLNENIEILDKLIDNVDNITNIYPVNTKSIAIWIESDQIKQDMLTSNVIREELLHSDSNPVSDTDTDSSDDETNTGRLHMLHNIINTEEDIYGNIYDSDTESESDNFLDDISNRIDLINYYDSYIENNY